MVAVRGRVWSEWGLPHELAGDPRFGPDFSLWRRIGVAQNRAIEFIN